MLNNLLTDIMLIAGFGAFLDTVFISKEERKRIAAYLEKSNTNLSLNQKFSIFLQRGHAIIFGRYLSSKFLSIGFIASAAIISLISFSIVIAAQALLFPDQFAGLKFDPIQIGLFAAFIFFNICFDYFTIIQTKIFIEASLSTKSIFRSALFIISDLFVTINTFILSYAIFVLIVVQWFVWNPVYAYFVIQDAPNSLKIDSETESRFLNQYENAPFTQRILYQDRVNAILLPSDHKQEAEHTIVFFYSSFDLDNPNARALLISKFTSLNFEILEISAIKDEQEQKRFHEIFKLVTDPLVQTFNENDQGLTIVKFKVNGSVWQDGNIYETYSASFTLTDLLEDGFPGSLTNSLELLNLSRLIQNTMAAPILDKLTVVCFEDYRPTIRLRIETNTNDVLEKCENFVVVEQTWTTAIDRDLSLIGRKTEGYRVPFNTLLITSLLPTAFFYFCIILLAISVWLFSLVVIKMNRVKKFFLRAPLTVSCFLLGAAISVIGLI